MYAIFIQPARQTASYGNETIKKLCHPCFYFLYKEKITDLSEWF